MDFNIYEPAFMAGVIKEKKPIYTFIKDRYFTADTSVFKTEQVLADYDDGGGSIMAPFVIPLAGPVPMTRDGYETREIKPPFISVSMPLTIEDLKKRMAGESIVSTLTPQDRERVHLVSDMDKLDKAITRREEWMCVNTMLDNACTMRHTGANGEKGHDMKAQFYDGNTNPGVFKPSAVWAASTDGKNPGTWYQDVCAQLSAMRKASRNATDLIVGSQVAQLIMNDPYMERMLDNRRIEIGELDPRWQENGVTRIGRFLFGGTFIEVYCYEGTYEEQDPKTRKITGVKDYLPATAAILAAPKTGKMLYGAVNQMEEDKVFHTRVGTRVPKHIADVAHNTKETMLTSRPMAIPLVKSPWRSCRDVFSTT